MGFPAEGCKKAAFHTNNAGTFALNYLVNDGGFESRSLLEVGVSLRLWLTNEKFFNLSSVLLINWELAGVATC